MKNRIQKLVPVLTLLSVAPAFANGPIEEVVVTGTPMPSFQPLDFFFGFGDFYPSPGQGERNVDAMFEQMGQACDAAYEEQLQCAADAEEIMGTAMDLCGVYAAEIAASLDEALEESQRCEERLLDLLEGEYDRCRSDFVDNCPLAPRSL